MQQPLTAQEWPARQVTIISPFQAGSTPDSVARILADRMQQKLRKPFIVENRPGARGNTGTTMVATAVPKGQTLGVSIVGPLVINALQFAKMPYDTAKNIEPITILASQPSVLTISPGVATDNVAALMAILKRNPDKFNYGSIGRGSLSHFAMESLAAKPDVKPCTSRIRVRPRPLPPFCEATCRCRCCPPGRSLNRLPKAS